jgi:hypothetical protein
MDMMVIPNRARVVAVMLALALAGGLLMLSLLAKPAQAQAETTTSTDHSTFNTSVFNGCTGDTSELFFIEGTMDTVAHTTIDANGERHTTFYNSIKGRGESDSGAKYVINQEFKFHENFQAGDPEYNVTFTQTIKLMLVGSYRSTADDETVKVVSHQTLTPEGELTSEVVRFEQECT